jgi:hypothetical protein
MPGNDPGRGGTVIEMDTSPPRAPIRNHLDLTFEERREVTLGFLQEYGPRIPFALNAGRAIERLKEKEPS